MGTNVLNLKSNNKSTVKFFENSVLEIRGEVVFLKRILKGLISTRKNLQKTFC